MYDTLVTLSAFVSTGYTLVYSHRVIILMQVAFFGPLAFNKLYCRFLHFVSLLDMPINILYK